SLPLARLLFLGAARMAMTAISTASCSQSPPFTSRILANDQAPARPCARRWLRSGRRPLAPRRVYLAMLMGSLRYLLPQPIEQKRCRTGARPASAMVVAARTGETLPIGRLGIVLGLEARPSGADGGTPRSSRRLRPITFRGMAAAALPPA